MTTEIEKLSMLFHTTFPEWELPAAKAAEWLEKFGYKSCEHAIEIAKERKPEKPLSYVYVVLRERNVSVKKHAKHAFVTSALRERYEDFVEDGELTADELDTLCRARAGQKFDDEILLSAEYRLRRAVYPNSRNWLPPACGYWEKCAWREMSEDERRVFSLPDLRNRAMQLKSQWANSDKFQKMSISDVLGELRGMGRNKGGGENA